MELYPPLQRKSSTTEPQLPLLRLDFTTLSFFPKSGRRTIVADSVKSKLLRPISNQGEHLRPPTDLPDLSFPLLRAHSKLSTEAPFPPPLSPVAGHLWASS